MYYDTVIQKSTNKIRATWDIVKTLTNSKSNNKKLITKDKKETEKTVNAFNHYFSTIAEQLNKDCIKEHNNKIRDPIANLRLTVNKPNDMIRLENTTTQEVNKIICSLKTKDSLGHDGISTKILKLSAPYIVSP